MDPQQFDALSRTFAHASSRRQAMARAGAAGLLAGLATAFGRGRAEALPAVQGETCRLDIVATVRLGPDATERMQTDVPGELRGEISFTLGPDGAIDAGRFLLDGGPEVPVVGQATGRALNLRADLQAVQEGLALVLVGTAEQPLNRCTGAVDGYLTGPLPGDLGDWHATATAIAGGNENDLTDAKPHARPGRAERAIVLPGLTRCGSTCVDLSSDAQQLQRLSAGLLGRSELHQWSCLGPPDRSTSATAAVSISTPILLTAGDAVRSARAVAMRRRVPRRRVRAGGLCGGMEYCGAVDLCRDLSSDPAHCGACGNACPSGFCSGGVCQSVPIANIPLDEAPPDGISSCLPGLVYCGNGVCVDIYIDSFNCGGCGITCQYPQGCQGGVCVG